MTAPASHCRARAAGAVLAVGRVVTPPASRQRARPASTALALAALAALVALAPTLAAAADPAVHRARRERLAAQLEPGEIVLIRGAPPIDVEWAMPYRQTSNFFYLTGVETPGAALLLSRDERGAMRDILFLPARDERRERWEGPVLHATAERAKGLGFDEVAAASALERRIAAALPAGRAPLTEDAVRSKIHGLRLVKDAGEIEAIRRATRVTGDALVEAMRSAEPGMNERDLAALIEYVFRRGGASGPGFPMIVGSGPNSCILHYSRNDRVMQAGELVVCDVGAEIGRYTADVTRTFPVSGRFSAEQRRVYEAVLRAQEAGIAAVCPGATIGDVHAAAVRSLAQDGLARHFIHQTSHWLGLDVHDVGSYAVELVPGMVLTVEPGAYLADDAIGVRIEDDVVVTESGCEVLTAWIPRRPDEIERLMAEKGLGNAPVRPYRPDARGAKRGGF